MRTYRFADAHRPGLLLGLAARQAVPVVAGVLFLALVLQSPLPPLVGLIGPVAGCGLAFGRWRGTPLADTLVPGIRLLTARRLGTARWVRPPLLGDNTSAALPQVLHGLELWEPPDSGFAVVRDRTAGTVTAVLRVRGQGFPLASPGEQDAMLTGWGAALSPFAREQSPVSQVLWQEWSHPVASDDHRAFLDSIGIGTRSGEAAVADYMALVDEQAPVTIAHDVLVAVTVDQRRIRTRRTSRSRLTAAVDSLADELRLFGPRLDAAGLSVEGPLSPVELSADVRVRSDPGRAAQVTTLTRSLAAATRRGALEWGPMAVEADWGHVRVDGAYHRSYWIAGWPRLPVGADWLAGLLVETHCLRTVTVVLEPVPMGRAARAADREVMAARPTATSSNARVSGSMPANANGWPTPRPGNGSCPKATPSSASSASSPSPPPPSTSSTTTAPMLNRPQPRACSTCAPSTRATTAAGRPPCRSAAPPPPKRPHDKTADGSPWRPPRRSCPGTLAVLGGAPARAAPSHHGPSRLRVPLPHRHRRW